VEDLLGNATLATNASAKLLQDPVSLGFSNSASLLDVKTVLGQAYEDAAELVAQTVVQDLPKLLACDTATTGELGCATQLIQRLGKRAYRRPLTSVEESAYVTRYQKMRADYDFKTGVEWIVSSILQSPGFLYRPEIDTTPVGTVRPLTGLERASRLASLIWQSIPDDTLIAAATEGRLATAQDMDREARRMLADPRGKRSLQFFTEWLDVDKMGQYARGGTYSDVNTTTLPGLLRQETEAFVRSVVFDGDSKLGTLLNADFTYANDALAQHYGLPSPASPTTFKKVSLPQGRRGLWMLGGPLSAHDKATRTSIVLRGMRFRTALLCQNIPAPPDNVNLQLPPVDATATQADRLAAHRTDPTCASCHTLMDPIGGLFENIDAVGRVRTVDEGGHTVQTAGEVPSLVGVTGTVADGAALLGMVTNTDPVRQCFSTQLFRFTHGREEQLEDGCSQKQAYDRFAAAGFDVKELLVGIVTSDDFLFREVPQ
jgi:hypothetical protein